MRRNGRGARAEEVEEEENEEEEELGLALGFFGSVVVPLFFTPSSPIQSGSGVPRWFRMVGSSPGTSASYVIPKIFILFTERLCCLMEAKRT